MVSKTLLLLLTIFKSRVNAFVPKQSSKVTVPTRNINTTTAMKIPPSPSSASKLFQSSSSTPSPNTNNTNNWRTKLLRLSNMASLLCVIDCTVLPIITILLPLIGLGAGAAHADWLHHLGHSIALFFVLPVGGLAATMNYTSHKNNKLSSLSMLGLSFIYMANAPSHSSFPLNLFPHEFACALHCGTILHKAVNLSGCALLLGSNYYGHKLSCSSGSGGDDHCGDCGHGHDHSHTD